MKIYPEILLAANSNKETARMMGGIKFYFIAKHFNKEAGSGLVHEVKFKEYIKRYVGISRATYYRWKKQALELGLCINRGEVLQLVSWGRAAVSCGCERVTQAVGVSLKAFTENEGLSEVWAGYIKRFEPKPASDKHPAQKQKPITKATLRKLSGIPESTQRYYEAKAGVIKTANIAHIVSTYQGTENAPAEEGGGYYAKNGCHRKRLGNTYKAPKHIKSLKRGRISKINGFINATLSLMPGSDQADKHIKIFFHPVYKMRPREAIRHDMKRDPEKAVNLYYRLSPENQIIGYLKRLSKVNAKKRPEYLYQYDRTALGVGLWVAWETRQAVTC